MPYNPDNVVHGFCSRFINEAFAAKKTGITEFLHPARSIYAIPDLLKWMEHFKNQRLPFAVTLEISNNKPVYRFWVIRQKNVRTGAQKSKRKVGKIKKHCMRCRVKYKDYPYESTLGREEQAGLCPHCTLLVEKSGAPMEHVSNGQAAQEWVRTHKLPRI